MKLPALSILCLVSFCSTCIASEKTSYLELLSATESARKSAEDMNAEWRDIRPLMKKAARLARNGEYADAMKLLEFAKFQAETGIKQAEENKNPSMPGYLKIK